MPIMTWLGNSVLVTVIVTALRVFLDSLAGYALSRLHFRGRNALFAAVLAWVELAAECLERPADVVVYVEDVVGHRVAAV